MNASHQRAEWTNQRAALQACRARSHLHQRDVRIAQVATGKMHASWHTGLPAEYAGQTRREAFRPTELPTVSTFVLHAPTLQPKHVKAHQIGCQSGRPRVAFPFPYGPAHMAEK